MGLRLAALATVLLLLGAASAAPKPSAAAKPANIQALADVLDGSQQAAWADKLEADYPVGVKLLSHSVIAAAGAGVPPPGCRDKTPWTVAYGLAGVQSSCVTAQSCLQTQFAYGTEL
jgi:hypothetical protein